MRENQGGFTLQKAIVSVAGAETAKTFSSMGREQEGGWSGERPVPLQGHQCTVTVLDHETSPSVEGARQDPPATFSNKHTGATGPPNPGDLHCIR